MAHAICDACGKETHWRAQRGVRLAGLRCPSCGGSLHGLTKGRPGERSTYRVCRICGHRRIRGSVTEKPTLFSAIGHPSTGLPDGPGWTVVVPAGEFVCHWHTRGSDLRSSEEPNG